MLPVLQRLGDAYGFWYCSFLYRDCLATGYAPVGDLLPVMAD